MIVKCKFEHSGLCCNCGSMHYLFYCQLPCETIISMTNADRFRDMSDEEQQKCVRRFYEVEDFADWLKQPAEEVDENA